MNHEKALTRLSFRLTALALILWSGFGVYEAATRTSVQRESQREVARRLAGFIADAVAISREHDQAPLESVLVERFLTSDDSIVSVTVFDRDGSVRERANRENISAETAVEEARATISGPSHPKPWGEVVVAYARSAQVSQLFDSLRAMLFALLVTAVIFCWVFSTTLRYLVELPLVRLVEQAKRFRSGELNERVSSSRRDVIGVLSNTLDDVRNEIKTTQKANEEGNQQLRELDRLKNEFLSTMSHEIRTPMTGVIGMSQLLLESRLTSEQRQFVDTIRNSSESLLTLINDMLDLSKVRKGELDLESVEFDLRTLAGEVIELTAEHSGSQALDFAYFVDDALPERVVADPHRLRQILSCLLSTVVDQSESGEIILRMSQAEMYGDALTLRIEITGTEWNLASPELLDSSGLDEGDETDDTRMMAFGGRGLSFSLSKLLTELMGGTLGIDGGSGTTLWFTVVTRPVETNVTRLSIPGSFEGFRVLIADDSESCRAMLESHVASWNMRATSAADGKEAVGLFECAEVAGKPYDLVILDSEMPGGDGLEAARQIHEIAKTPPRIILMTTRTCRITQREREGSGVDATLRKPIRQSRLRECLKGMADERPSDESGSRTSSSRSKRPTGKILVAEDNRINQKLAVAILQKCGYRSDVANNGREAVDMIRDGDYALVFMDCHMPEMDGFEATRTIRECELSSGGRLPIIALTASSMPGAREECLTAGMDDYLAKPIKPSDVRIILRHWVEEANASTEKPQA